MISFMRLLNMTTVVNLRFEKCDIKIGRPSCFGNPFFLKNTECDYERAEVIRKYKEYFYKRINDDPDFKLAVEGLRGKKLGCFCKPKACHGDVIVEYLECQG